jgi:hypothetical protein
LLEGMVSSFHEIGQVFRLSGEDQPYLVVHHLMERLRPLL